MAMGSVTVENIYGIPLGFRLMNAVVLVQEYFTLLLFPYPLMIFHDVPQVSGLFDPHFLLSVLMIGFLIGFCIWNRKSYPGFLLSGLWFLITLFPVLNIIPIPSPSVMERSAYLPSIGFSLGIGWAGRYFLDRWASRGAFWPMQALRGIFILILVVFSAMTVQRNFVWQDEVLIWEDLYRKVSTESHLGHFNLGREYHIRGELDQAEKEYRLALKYAQKPNPNIHQYLAMIYQKKRRSHDAIREYEIAIALGSDKAQVYYKLGLELLKQGRDEEGLGRIQKAIDIDPDYLKAHLQLAMRYANQKEIQKAIAEFLEVSRIDPQEDRSHFRLAGLYDTQGSEEKAREHYLLFLNKAQPHPLMEKMISQAQKRLRVLEERKPSR
jgi:Tfp pilus assembly protein PilF